MKPDQRDYVVVRSTRCVGQEPAAAARREPCDVCGQDVFITESLFVEIAEGYPGYEIRARCMECTTDEGLCETDFAVAPGQILEMQANGMSNVEIVFVLALAKVAGRDRTFEEVRDAVAADPNSDEGIMYLAAIREMAELVVGLQRRN